MATSTFNIAIVLSAIDRMSGVINSGVNQSIASLDKMKKAGQENLMKGAGMFGSGLAVAAAMKPALDAYEELEAAQAKMASRVMRAGGGIDKTILSALSAESERLGNKLPGTTAELTDMFTVMLENGVDAKRIVDGLGSATADFAVVAGLAYPEAAQFVSRMSNKMGIADEDARAFLDTLNRTKQEGVSVDELGYAFGRAGGRLQALGMSGIDAFKKIAPLMGTLVHGASGETAGTSFAATLANITNLDMLSKANGLMRSFGASALSFTDKAGNFKGEDNMFRQFEKISKLSKAQQNAINNVFSGTKGEDYNTFAKTIDMMANGMAKYNKELASIEAKASVSDQLKVQLETFKALKEAAGGTWTNALAAMAESLKPEIIAITKALAAAATWIQQMAKAHPAIFRFIGTFMALTSAVLLVGGALLVAKGAFMVLSAMTLGTPIGATLALVGALSLYIAKSEEAEMTSVQRWAREAGRIEAMKQALIPLATLMNAIWNPGHDEGETSWDDVVKSFKNADYSGAYDRGYNEYMRNNASAHEDEKYGKGSFKSKGAAERYVMYNSPTFVIQGNADKNVILDMFKASNDELHDVQRKSFRYPFLEQQ